jgi:hypothetical protein
MTVRLMERTKVRPADLGLYDYSTRTAIQSSSNVLEECGRLGSLSQIASAFVSQHLQLREPKKLGSVFRIRGHYI